MLADLNFAQLNTWILAGVGLVTAGGVIFTGFNSKAVREANELLKTEMEASNARADRLEKERDDYREKLHASQNDLSGALGRLHLCELETVELRARTDFAPVMEFNKRWYAEQSEVMQKMMSVLSDNASVLTRTVAVLERLEPKLQTP